MDVVQNSSKPLFVGEIIQELKEKKILIDEVTVYRILDLFFEKGMIKKVLSPRSTKTRYELSGDDHHHFTCDSCGMIEDINICNVDKLVDGIRRNKKLLIKGHSLEFFGLCSKCH